MTFSRVSESCRGVTGGSRGFQGVSRGFQGFPTFGGFLWVSEEYL